MGPIKTEVLVTSALTQDEVRNALVLCYSLKRALLKSIHAIAVVASPSLPPNLREKLEVAFDFVFDLKHEEHQQQLSYLKLEDFAKLASIRFLQSFDRSVYLSPNMIAIKNPEIIFNEFNDKEFESLLFLEDMDTTVFLCQPSGDLYVALKANMKKYYNGDFGSCLKIFTESGQMEPQHLDKKYNMILKPGEAFLGNEKEISMVNLSEIQTFQGSSREKIDMTGLLGGKIWKLWQNIYYEDVKPLLEGHPRSTSKSPSLQYKREPIAIVGMGCRFPGSNNPEEFWNLLYKKEDGTCSPPPFRWLREQSYRHRPEYRKTNAGFLSVPIDEFDAKFFGMSPKELHFLDPQHRLLHEVVWESLEDACIDPHSLEGTSGSVFVGSWLQDYKDILRKSGNFEFYRSYMGTSIGAGAARISHFLEMTGPCVATESGCSSAMVAVHLACKSLQLGETNMALACGVNLLLHPFDKDEMPMVVSPDGQCKTFCETANGFARGEGCGVLVLKRLSDAVRDGDNIWALLRGSAMTQEGISKSMGTPTVQCESKAMIEALKDGDVNPADVSYVEAHGTGTVVGDPMEIAAIARSYHSPARTEPLIVGSVKTNVGHTESCSGITGIMKVVLSMQHDMIPAHRNLEKLNPAIDLDAVPARIPLEPIEWKRKEGGKSRLAGVSSFGITGTDAHVIVEEAPNHLLPKDEMKFDEECEIPVHILKISAKTDEALDVLMGKYEETLSSALDDVSLTNLLYSVNGGRANFSQRAVAIGKSKEDLVKQIRQRNILKGEASYSKELDKICFLFTGQGSQYPGMAQQLYKTSPVFKIHFDYCSNILKGKYKIDIKETMWGSNAQQISRTIYSQTSIFCVEYALLKLWESFGVKPDYALGHSLGEFAAAVCSGILTVNDAIKLVAERSLLIDQLPPGKMLVIKADLKQVDDAMTRFMANNKTKRLDYAAINSNEQTVVAGDSDVILAFAQFCKESCNMKCIVLEATHAFHSTHMDPMLKPYGKVAGTVKKPNESEGCSYISGMRGNLIQAEDVNSRYWVDHTREKVNFLNASTKAVELGCKIFLEIGPQPVLSALTMMNTDMNLLCLPSLKRNEEEWSTLLITVGKLYVKGLNIDWHGMNQFCRREKLHQLPTYPFLGKKFWPELMSVSGNLIHPLIGSCIPNAGSSKLFQSGISSSSHEYIKDHAIGQNVVFPGAGYLEMCLAAGLATVENTVEALGKPTRPMKLENLQIEAPLALEEGKTCQVQTVVDFNKSSDSTDDWNDMAVQIFHRVNSETSAPTWLSHAKATFSPIPSVEETRMSKEVWNMEKFQAKLNAQIKDGDLQVSEIYEKLASIGLKFGPVFRSIEKVWKKTENDGGLLAKVKPIGTEDDGQATNIIHPAVLDAMIQAIMMLKLTDNIKKKLYVPIKIGKFIWLSGNTTDETYVYAYDSEERTRGSGAGELSTQSCSALLLDGLGNTLAIMSEVEFIDTTVKAIEAVLATQLVTMPDLWEEVWRPKRGPLQYPMDLELCNGVKFYTEEERQHIINTCGVLSKDIHHTYLNLEKYVYLNILRALQELGWNPPSKHSIFSEEELFHQLKIKQEFRKFFGYFMKVLEEEGILEKKAGDGNNNTNWKILKSLPPLEQTLAELSSPHYTSDLVKRMNATLLYGKLGENLSKILTGKQDALSILFPDESKMTKGSPSVANFYTEYGTLFKVFESGRAASSLWMNHYKQVENQRIEKTGEKFVIRCLEVGAGTGAFAWQCLEQFRKFEVEFEYTYTDHSAAFFPAAEKRFENFMKNMTFKKLNIEDDPISQGFTPGYYDYICASDVIHATKDVVQTFKNLRSLLKPTGRFDMIEQIKVNRLITYLFGPLEGFWRFEDFQLRPNHCIITIDKWRSALETAGFEWIGDFPSVNENHSYICAINSKADIPLSLPLNNETGTKSWIIFHQKDSHMSNFLMKKMPQMSGRKMVPVFPGKYFDFVKGGFTVRVDSEEDFVKLMEHQDGDTVEGIIYAWSLETKRTSQNEILQPYFYLAKAVSSLKQAVSPRLLTLTSGIVPLENNKSEHIHNATIWGFTKSLKNEKIELNCRLIDISPAANDGNEKEMMQVFYEIWNREKETQVAYSGATRYIAKFQAFKPTGRDLKLPTGTDRFELIMPETKSISDLQFGPLDPLILEEDDVEVKVKASALNFRDVLSVIKPSDDFKNVNAVGFDFSGVVRKVGPKVTKWKVGDAVFGINMKRNALPSHSKFNQNDLLPIDDEMSFCEAATLPAVVATSYYCLIDIAKVKAGETVLIHTASGGVGLSAIEILKYLGAKIICTAGSRRKQTYLKSLGIQHIFHSRNTNYGQQILELTGGKGVDVVLNSLTSPGFKEATLKACAKGARFVEMSKLTIWQPEEVKKLRPDVDYTIVDVSALSSDEWRRLMNNLEDLAKKKLIHPIPYVRFDALNIREALQYLQKAKHIGKVVCVMPEVKQDSKGETVVYTPMFNEQGTYLITGGLGGIGFEVCKWMVEKGAKHVLLGGRNPPKSTTEQIISQLNSQYGAKIIPVKLDVGSFEQCQNLIKVKIPEMGYPHLKGIMHCAGILQDGLIQNQDWPKLSSTLNTKVTGTLNLHELTKSSDLEHFVMFSSIVALFGSPGQSNHAAGNNFEDTFAHYRNSLGLPATTINWGQWGQVGVATEIDLPGLKPFSNLQGITALEYALKSQRTQTCAVSIDSFVLLKKLIPHISSYLDERLWRQSYGSSSSSNVLLKSEEFWEKYDSKTEEEGKLEVVQESLRVILRNVLNLDEHDEIKDEQSFQDMGVDSLMFVEIKNALQALVGDRITVNASALRDCNNVKLLSETLVKVIEGEEISEENLKPPTPEEVVELIKEDSILPEHIRTKQSQIKVKVSDIKSVLLTGCTGTLGNYILRELSNLPQISNVICLMRPNTRQNEDEVRLRKILEEKDLLREISMKKISFVTGNIANPQLGLEPSLYEELASKVDAVVNCAAAVNHMELYRKRSSKQEDARSVNIGGMKNLLEFCCSGMKLKHIFQAGSLLSLTNVDNNGTISEEWPSLGDQDGTSSYAYSISKFVGEVLLKEAVMERGIPAKVFRFPFISGDSKTGRCVLNHLMLRYIFILKSGVMPSEPMPVNVLPVDVCAQASVQLFFNERCENEVYNVVHNMTEVDQQFVGVAKKLGYTVDCVEFAEFAKKVAEDSTYTVFKNLYSKDADVVSLFNNKILQQWITGGEEGMKKYSNCKKILGIVPDFYRKLEPGLDYIYQDLLFAKEQGWWKQYGLN